LRTARPGIGRPQHCDPHGISHDPRRFLGREACDGAAEIGGSILYPRAVAMA
jgi:hypothetical protein